MLKIIREILLKIVNDIDTGNSNLSPEECEEVIEFIGLTTSAEEFQNTFDHEKGHLAMHISSALKIKPYGEEYQYLTGEIGQSMFKIAKRFLCDDCRQKLVIEIKEIDKKD